MHDSRFEVGDLAVLTFSSNYRDREDELGDLRGATVTLKFRHGWNDSEKLPDGPDWMWDVELVEGDRHRWPIANFRVTEHSLRHEAEQKRIV